ncbi:hypothetical protein [Corynebacterium casei]|uniref:hypothetical protein n=1 Tax=Corynebacterium casei TaxID=160386 RepID=UPI003FD27F35
MKTWILPPTITYLTASELGIRTDASTRRRIWRQFPFKSTLQYLALMASQTSSDRANSFETDQFWLRRIENKQLRAKIRIALLDESTRMIAGQVVMNGMRELIELVDINSAANDTPVDIDLLIVALLSVADSLATGAELPEDWPNNPSIEKWGELASPLASHLIANILFNQLLPVRYLVTRAHDRWGGNWGARVTDLDKSRIKLQPRELYFEATGTNLESMTDVIYAFWSMHLAKNHVAFNEGFTTWARLDDEAHANAIDFLSINLEDLQYALKGEEDGIWAFNSIRRNPIVKLPDNSLVVLHVGWLFERGLGDPIIKDVREKLNSLDEKDSSLRSTSFHQAITQQFEDDVEKVLMRAFGDRKSKSENLVSKVWTESQLREAFSNSGKQKNAPKIPDFLIQFGETWFIIDATLREANPEISNENGSINDLTNELHKFIVCRKARQLDSMISLLKHNSEALNVSPLSPDTIFVPIIISGDYALPWTLPVAAELPKWLESENILQQDGTLPMAVFTFRDLLYLEHVAESIGPRALTLLREWRESPYNSWELNQFLDSKGIRLKLPHELKSATGRFSKT